MLGSLDVEDAHAAPHGEAAVADLLGGKVLHGLGRSAKVQRVEGEVSRGAARVAALVDGHPANELDDGQEQEGGGDDCERPISK